MRYYRLPECAGLYIKRIVMKATSRLAALRRLAFCVTLACSAAPAVAASFDCDKAGTPVERAICQQPPLGELDSKINDSYLRATGSMTAQDAAALRTEQRAWLKTRNACAGSASELNACLTASMTPRAQALKDIAQRATQNFDAAVSLIPTAPATAADKLRQYQTPLASAWLVYLNHFVPASGVTAQEASKRHQTALDGLKDDDFAYSIMKDIDSDPKESKDRAVLTLLRMHIERLDYGNDDDRPYVHCFIFPAQGQAAYEAFGALYGSSRDGAAPICAPQAAIFSSPAWKALNDAFSDVLSKVSEDAGTIQLRKLSPRTTPAPDPRFSVKSQPTGLAFFMPLLSGPAGAVDKNHPVIQPLAHDVISAVTGIFRRPATIFLKPFRGRLARGL